MTRAAAGCAAVMLALAGPALGQEGSYARLRQQAEPLATDACRFAGEASRVLDGMASATDDGDLRESTVRARLAPVADAALQRLSSTEQRLARRFNEFLRFVEQRAPGSLLLAYHTETREEVSQLVVRVERGELRCDTLRFPKGSGRR